MLSASSIDVSPLIAKYLTVAPGTRAVSVGSATTVAPAGGFTSGPDEEPSGLRTATSSRRPLSSNAAV